MHIMDDAALIYHHIASFVAAVSFMGMPEGAPRRRARPLTCLTHSALTCVGVGLFILCTTVFEAGSACYSIKNMAQHSAAVWDFFIVGHSLSNLGALACTYVYARDSADWNGALQAPAAQWEGHFGVA